MAMHQITMHCQCGHSKTWTHECPSSVLPWPKEVKSPTGTDPQLQRKTWNNDGQEV